MNGSHSVYTTQSLYLDRTQINENLSWLHEYRDQIENWGNLLHVVETAVNFVRSVGIYRECGIDLENELEE